MTIGEFARAGNVGTSRIRYYEARGVLQVPRRCGNARRYDDGDLAKLRSILIARRLGCSLRLTSRARAAAIDATIRKARVVRVLLQHADRHGAFVPERYATILARVGA